jgi:uncharacterized protein YecE (DUF72 family)
MKSCRTGFGSCVQSDMAEARIGISGWLAQRRELAYASRSMSSLEINGSFYSLQRPERYRGWYGETPDDFVFAVKGSRFITHMKKLRDVEGALANFFASGVLLLREKLGPFLWQLPPVFRFDEAKLDAFFELLPRDTAEAAALARKHDHRVAGRAWLEADRRRPIRHALEVRHESFRSERFVRLLRRHRIALVVADTAGRWPLLEDVTADFVYVRLHGSEELYASGYTASALDMWAKRVKVWLAGREVEDARRACPTGPRPRRGRDVYVYFDNDAKVHAPFDALALAARVSGRPVERVHPGSGGEPPRTSWPRIRRRSIN